MLCLCLQLSNLTCTYIQLQPDFPQIAKFNDRDNISRYMVRRGGVRGGGGGNTHTVRAGADDSRYSTYAQ